MGGLAVHSSRERRLSSTHRAHHTTPARAGGVWWPSPMDWITKVFQLGRDAERRRAFEARFPARSRTGRERRSTSLERRRSPEARRQSARAAEAGSSSNSKVDEGDVSKSAMPRRQSAPAVLNLASLSPKLSSLSGSTNERTAHEAGSAAATAAGTPAASSHAGRKATLGAARNATASSSAAIGSLDVSDELVSTESGDTAVSIASTAHAPAAALPHGRDEHGSSCGDSRGSRGSRGSMLLLPAQQKLVC